jgi:hypothetical protein
MTEDDWARIAPPRPEPSEAALEEARRLFETETDADYLRRLFAEQN